MTTGYVEGAAYTEFVQTTHAAVLSKPVDIDELRDRVQHVLGRPIVMADGGRWPPSSDQRQGRETITGVD
jgi:hypothetical protein